MRFLSFNPLCNLSKLRVQELWHLSVLSLQILLFFIVDNIHIGWWILVMIGTTFTFSVLYYLRLILGLDLLVRICSLDDLYLTLSVNNHWIGNFMMYFFRIDFNWRVQLCDHILQRFNGNDLNGALSINLIIADEESTFPILNLCILSIFIRFLLIGLLLRLWLLLNLLLIFNNLWRIIFCRNC